jgi:hydroxymethylpyrimidine/phosphomethylpyrimidine kinase
MEERNKPIVISVAGSDPSGGAGIQADLRAFEATGVYGMTVITAITVQTATKVFRWNAVDPALIKDQLMTLLEAYPISVVKCGMLPSKECMQIIADAKHHFDFRLVVDPILTSTSGTELMPESIRNDFKQIILPITDVLTPNADEVVVLTGKSITDMASLLSIGKDFESRGVKAVVFKGGHIAPQGLQIMDYLYEDGHMEMFSRERIETSGSVHGTGCIFSAILAAQMALTESVYEAMINTEEQMENAFRHLFYLPSVKADGIPVPSQKGNGIILDLGVTEAERQILEEVQQVYQFLRTRPDYVPLIPEVRTNISICRLGAKTTAEVAAVEGRITVVNNLPYAAGPIKLGVSNHTARLLLAAHQKDPHQRAVINIRFNPDLIIPLQEAGLVLYEIKREAQPEAVRQQEKSTMHWVVEATYRDLQKIPDIIWDCGEPEKEPMIRLFAESGKQLIEKIQTVLRVAKDVKN